MVEQTEAMIEQLRLSQRGELPDLGSCAL